VSRYDYRIDFAYTDDDGGRAVGHWWLPATRTRSAGTRSAGSARRCNSGCAARTSPYGP
jgi:hypothetical protein